MMGIYDVSQTVARQCSRQHVVTWRGRGPGQLRHVKLSFVEPRRQTVARQGDRGRW